MVDLDVDDGLAIVTIDRPHARNAISVETMHRLDEALDGAAGARALVITGAALVGKSQALLLAGTGAILSAADAERVGLIQRVVSRESFEDEWRAVARKLAATPVEAIKRVIAGTTKEEAVSAFASLWVSDAHWTAADKVMNRGRPAASPSMDW